MISTEVGGDAAASRRVAHNIAPELKVEGEKRRTVKVGEPLRSPRRQRSRQHSGARAPRPPATPRRRRRRSTGRRRRRDVEPGGPALFVDRLSRQGVDVTFSPEQMKTWTDTRAYANSPWSPPYVIPEPPPDNRWRAPATFAEPGTYVLRGVASDGSLFTYENVTVTVTR